jgi:transposase
LIEQESWATFRGKPEWTSAIADAGREGSIVSELAALGLDVGKYKVSAALLREGRKKDKTFSNDAAGHAAVVAWLKEHGVERVHACLESTGGFSEALATVLFDAGHLVSIVNPTRIKAFGKTEMVRTKTDKVDAALIARFCQLHRPSSWTPLPQNIRQIQALSRRLDGLIDMRAQEQNRLEAPGNVEAVQVSIREAIKWLDAEIVKIERQLQELIKDDPDMRNKRDLLLSIQGIGERTADRILGEMPHLEEFRSAKAVAAYVGLSPREWQSGTLRGRTRISKMGNSRLRKALYWPAISAMRTNPPIRRFAQRLLAAGKHGMLVIAAVMRKLICQAFAVVRSGCPFDPTRAG